MTNREMAYNVLFWRKNFLRLRRPSASIGPYAVFWDYGGSGKRTISKSAGATIDEERLENSTRLGAYTGCAI
jgi:hypothetical protein